MIPGIILTPDIITALSLCHYHMARRHFDTWQFFLLFFKNNSKKQIEELTRDIPFNVVTVPLTERTKLISNFPK